MLHLNFAITAEIYNLQNYAGIKLDCLKKYIMESGSTFPLFICIVFVTNIWNFLILYSNSLSVYRNGNRYIEMLTKYCQNLAMRVTGMYEKLGFGICLYRM
jgi:hypothetical protein